MTARIRSAAELYEKLIGEDKVDLLVGPYSSNITMAAAQVAEAHNFPMLTLAASADDIWNQDYDNIIGLDTLDALYGHCHRGRGPAGRQDHGAAVGG